MKNITAVPLLSLFLIFLKSVSMEQLTGYFFREELTEFEHILFLQDLKNIAPFSSLNDSDILYEPPQDFLLFLHEKEYMIFAKSFNEQEAALSENSVSNSRERKTDIQIKQQDYNLKLNDVHWLIRAENREKINHKVRVVEEDFTRDQNGMIYFEGFSYDIFKPKGTKATSLLVSKMGSAPLLIENQVVVYPQKSELITSFKTKKIHIIYVASGSLCSDSSFTKSKSRDDSIGANRRLCRELIHWLMQQDPLVQQSKFEEPDPQFQIHKTRNILSLPIIPYYLQIWLLVLLFFWFLLKFIYSGHKDWVRQDKLKDKKPEEPLPSFEDHLNKKKRKVLDAKPLYSSVKEARRRKPEDIEPLNGQQE